MTTMTRRPVRLAATHRPGAESAQDWRMQAVCRDMDPEIWFPIGMTVPAQQQTSKAKTLCHTCPVREACLQWAVATNQETGVWGGLSEDERYRLRRRTARQDARVPAAQRILAEKGEEFHDARARGLSVYETAQLLGTNSQTVNEAIAVLEEQALVLDTASDQTEVAA